MNNYEQRIILLEYTVNVLQAEIKIIHKLVARLYKREI